MSLFNRLFSRNRRYDDISVSIQEHIGERADELMEEGMSRERAERAARREHCPDHLVGHLGRAGRPGGPDRLDVPGHLPSPAVLGEDQQPGFELRGAGGEGTGKIHEIF